MRLPSPKPLEQFPRRIRVGVATLLAAKEGADVPPIHSPQELHQGSSLMMTCMPGQSARFGWGSMECHNTSHQSIHT